MKYFYPALITFLGLIPLVIAHITLGIEHMVYVGFAFSFFILAYMRWLIHVAVRNRNTQIAKRQKRKR